MENYLLNLLLRRMVEPDLVYTCQKTLLRHMEARYGPTITQMDEVPHFALHYPSRPFPEVSVQKGEILERNQIEFSFGLG